jgi:hypothetical protein
VKKILAFGLAASFLFGLSVICKPAPAIAQSAVGINAQCAFLEDDCATPDTSNVVTSASIAINADGIWTSNCHGATTHLPKKAKTCMGKTLTTIPCNLETFGSGGNKGPKTTSNWVETISTAGNVNLTCKFTP